MVGHRLLLARRFGVEVDDHQPDRRIETGQNPVRGDERRRQRLHERLPFQIDHRVRRPYRQFADEDPDARVAFRVVRGPQQSWYPVEERHTFPLRPGVIAGCHAVDRQRTELVEHRRGHAAAAGGILDVDDHRVDAVAVDQLRQQARQGAAPRLADHIADKEEAGHQRAYSIDRDSRITVTLIWPG